MDDFKESNLYQYAKKELELIGYDFSSKEKNMNNLMRDNILELLEVFYKQGHSAFSVNYVINLFTKLAKFEPLKPVTDEEGEWVEVVENMYQHKRLANLCKNGKDGKPYYCTAIIFRDQNGNTFVSGNVEGISSAQYVKSFPFTPKSFYIDVFSYEVDPEDETILKPGSAWWKHKIKDKKQLKPVWGYYDKARRKND